MLTDIAKDHFLHPRHVGALEAADGVGTEGTPGAGNFMIISLRLQQGGLTGGEGVSRALEKTLQYDPPTQRVRLSAVGPGGGSASVSGAGSNGRLCHGTDLTRGIVHGGRSCLY